MDHEIPVLKKCDVKYEGYAIQYRRTKFHAWAQWTELMFKSRAEAQEYAERTVNPLHQFKVVPAVFYV